MLLVVGGVGGLGNVSSVVLRLRPLIICILARERSAAFLSYSTRRDDSRYRANHLISLDRGDPYVSCCDSQPYHCP